MTERHPIQTHHVKHILHVYTGSPYCGEPFQQLDCQARQRRVVFVVNILGQDNYEIVAVATVLCQGLLQRGHDVGRRLQTDDVVGDGEGQFDCLDEDLTGTLRTTAGPRQRRNNI